MYDLSVVCYVKLMVRCVRNLPCLGDVRFVRSLSCLGDVRFVRSLSCLGDVRFVRICHV